MKEVWKDIKDFEGFYQISNLGRLKTLARTVGARNGKTREISAKILVIQHNEQGYCRITFTKNKKIFGRKVHRLVAYHFIGEPSTNQTDVNHKDGNKENNRVDNLEWCTRGENVSHAIRTGLKKITGVKLDFKTANRIRDIYEATEPELGHMPAMRSLTKKYNVSISTIRDIITKKTWWNKWI